MTTNEWKKEKAVCESKLTAELQVLVGAKIQSVNGHGHQQDCDGVNQITLVTDKGTFLLTGSYGGYTGNSCDEYYEFISISPHQPPQAY